MSETAVSSFIIRFTQEQPTKIAAASWHGFIRHVQSAEERHFTRMEEALTFMAAHTNIGDEFFTRRQNEK